MICGCKGNNKKLCAQTILYKISIFKAFFDMNQVPDKFQTDYDEEVTEICCPECNQTFDVDWEDDDNNK